MATKKKAAKKVTRKKTAPKKTVRKKAVPKKAGKKKAAKKKGAVKTKNVGKKNKLGVENSLVNNINARKEKGVSRSKSKKTISKESYKHMQNNWED